MCYDTLGIKSTVYDKDIIMTNEIHSLVSHLYLYTPVICPQFMLSVSMSSNLQLLSLFLPVDLMMFATLKSPFN